MMNLSQEVYTSLPDGEGLSRVAFLARCLADENRLRIVIAVSTEEKPVSRIVEEVGISQPLVSHHLKELKRALLVTVRRRGPFVFYRLADAGVVAVIESLDRLALELLARRSGF